MSTKKEGDGSAYLALAIACITALLPIFISQPLSPVVYFFVMGVLVFLIVETINKYSSKIDVDSSINEFYLAKIADMNKDDFEHYIKNELETESKKYKSGLSEYGKAKAVIKGINKYAHEIDDDDIDLSTERANG